MDRSIKTASSYLLQVQSSLTACEGQMLDVLARRLFVALRDGRRVFLFGNGGSAALASHFACDLAKGVTFGVTERRLKVIAVTDNVALITAWSNDVGYEVVFREQIRNLCEKGDVLFAISGSGNSANVLRALEFGQEIGAINLGMSGFAGGKMKALCEACFVVPSENMQIIEDVHTIGTHTISTVLFNLIAESELPHTASAAAGVSR